MPAALLPLTNIAELQKWYEQNLCGAVLKDPRGFRVRFIQETLVHLIQMKTKYGGEPKNKRLTVEQIRSGKIQLTPRRFDPQRAQELSWVPEIACNPDLICRNWQALGTGGEAYVKNFGTPEQPQLRVMICKVTGQRREVVTIFPRGRLGEKELAAKIWP